MTDADIDRRLAVLENEIAHVRNDISEMRQELKYLSGHLAQIANDQLKRIHDLENKQSANTEKWEAHKGEHAREANNQKIFHSINLF